MENRRKNHVQRDVMPKIFIYTLNARIIDKFRLEDQAKPIREVLVGSNQNVIFNPC